MNVAEKERKTMDKGAERIAQDMKEIAQTRVAIAEKLGAIEQHVGVTMQHARTMMTDLADKTTSSVRETMQVTKEALDPGVHVTRHPWISVGGAVVLGYALGAIYCRDWRITSGVVPYYPPGAKGAGVMSASGSSATESRESGVYPFYTHSAADYGGGEQGRPDRSTIWGEVERALQDELGEARNGIIRLGRSLLREMVRQTVPALVQMVVGNHRERDSRSATDPARR
jgi:ElaB/YqjD/DUF883 family membrane-anchored ribosome-binding protein